MVEFPAPVGGTVLSEDFAPSIFFAILYAILVPLMLYRLFDRRTRCLILIGTMFFTIERVVIFSLRAVQARNDVLRLNSGLVTYMQITFGLGFIGIASDAVKITKCLLVNATYESKGGVVPPPTADTPDQPRMRSWSRRFIAFLDLSYLAAIVLGIIANSTNYSNEFGSQSSADWVTSTRIADSAVVVALSFIVVCAALWSHLKLPRVSKRGVAIIGATFILIIVIGIYRLLVMWIRTISLSAPNVLNMPSAKAAFYLFHVLPEWLVTLILYKNDIRKIFGTGLWGDWRWRDETKKQRAKREKQEAKGQQDKMDLVYDEKFEMISQA